MEGKSPMYDRPFGGVSLMLVGDLLQLRPVQAGWIFSKPQDSKGSETVKAYQLYYEEDSLWHQFQAIVLIGGIQT